MSSPEKLLDQIESRDDFLRFVERARRRSRSEESVSPVRMARDAS